MYKVGRPCVLISLMLAVGCGESDSSSEAASATAIAPSSAGSSASSVVPRTPTTGAATASGTKSGGSTSATGAQVSAGAAGAAASVSAPDIVDTLPPEKETVVSFQLPQASEHYVYAMNPEAGTVAIIDASTQAIQTIKTGGQPTYLRTLAGTYNAIVLNIASTRASIIRMRDEKAQKSDLSVNAGANAIAVAPDGKHVVVYFNANYMSTGKTPG